MGCGCSDDSGGWDHSPPYRGVQQDSWRPVRERPAYPEVLLGSDENRKGRWSSALQDLGYSCGAVSVGFYLSALAEDKISRCRVFVPIYTKDCPEGMIEAVKFAMKEQKRILPVWYSGKFPLSFAASYKHGLPRVPRSGLPYECCDCDAVEELDVVLLEDFKREEEEEWVTDDEEEVLESGDEDNYREMLDAEETAPTRSNPSLSSHRSSPLKPPSLSSRPSPAASELPTTSKDQKVKKTVTFFDMQPQGRGRKVQLRSLATQKKKKKHQSLLPLQGQRNKQPNGNLSQASPYEEEGQLKKAAASSSPIIKEASKLMPAESVAGGRLAGTEPCTIPPCLGASPLREPAIKEVATKVPAPSNAPERRPAVTAAQEVMGMPVKSPGAKLKAKPAVEVKVQDMKTNSGGEKAVKGNNGPLPVAASALPAEPAIKQVKPAVEVKVQDMKTNSGGEKALKGNNGPLSVAASALPAEPAIKQVKPAVEVKVQDMKTNSGGEKALKGNNGPLPVAASALPAEPAIKQAKPAVEVKVQNSAASSSAEKAGKAKVSPDPAPAQLMLSYRVKEMGSKSQGGDGIILRLQAALEAQGFSVFVGESDIEGGDSWTQAIQRAIDGCAIFIPVCSATFGAGGWTYKEVLYALSEHKAMIPVWHSSTYPPPDLKMMIQSFQRVPRGALPLTECDFDEVVTELVSCIRKKLAPGGLV